MCRSAINKTFKILGKEDIGMKKSVLQAVLVYTVLAGIVTNLIAADDSTPRGAQSSQQNASEIFPSEIQLNTLQKDGSSQQPETMATSDKSTDPTINFNNVAIIEYIRFLSKLSNKNFVFDDADLQFNVTIVSEQPTPVSNLMSALLQELQIRNLSLTEQGNTILIHQNPRVRSPGSVVSDGFSTSSKESEIVTRVFRLNTLDPNKAGDIIRPLLSIDSLVEILQNTNTIIVTDLNSNVNKIAQLLSTLDSPNSGMQIGHYIVKNGNADSITALAEQILQPIAQGNPFILIPHSTSNSVFIVSNPFIVERAVAIFQYLDENDSKTKILTLDRLRMEQEAERRAREAAGLAGRAGLGTASSGAGAAGTHAIYHPGGLNPGEISPYSRSVKELPAGHIDRTLFYIYKLRYRKGDQIQTSLRKIAESLQTSGTINAELISGINSTQWIESTNSLIFTGTVSALDRISELLKEIDVPLRQVFIEVLILDTTLADSLEYGVDWGARFGGGNIAGGEAFIAPSSILPGALDTAGVGLIPNPNLLARLEGFHLGIIGQQITHQGRHFATLGGLVNALHSNTRTNILMNPKIITEENNPAEIFVGATTRYKTQSISNDLGTVLTNNFQFLDVGTTLKVTPQIGNNGIITLDIYQETTNETPNANPQLNQNNSANNTDVNLVPVTSKNKTTTKLHVPNKYFVIMSGMITDTRVKDKRQIPCLGGIPLLGGAAKQKRNSDDKRNLLIFIRPEIADTEDELTDLTRRQQNIFIDKNKFKRSWNYEVDEALDFFNLERNEQDEVWNCADLE